MNQQGYGPHPPSGGATQNDHRGGSTHDPVASIASWAKGVASDNLDEIKAGFNLQKAAIDLDEARNNKNKGSPQFRRKLENIGCMGTGSFLVIAAPNSTKLSFVCGMGGFTDSLVSVSEHDGKNIGMISDRTEHSEAAPGAVDWVGMNKYYTVEACDSVIELSTFYGDAQNRLKRFDVSDSSTRAYKFMPGFLVLPQELIAWFLEAEPTAYELHEKLLGLVGTGQAPDELQVALKSCRVVIAAARKMRAVFCKQYCQQNPIGRDALDELSPRGSRVGGISFQEVQVVSKRELTSCGRRVRRSLLLVAIADFSRCELATFDDRHPLPELAERK